MSLRVAVDNVETLDVYNFRDIANCARRWADKIEAEHAELPRVLVICQWPEGVGIDVWGDMTASPFELVGILEAAKLRAHEVNVVGEE